MTILGKEYLTIDESEWRKDLYDGENSKKGDFSGRQLSATVSDFKELKLFIYLY